MISTRFLSSAVRISAFVVVVTGGRSAAAQPVTNNLALGVSRHVSVETRAQDSVKGIENADRASNTVFRVFTGAIMSGAGMIGGAYVGAKSEGPCGCEDPGLQGGLIGGLAGMIAGASIGASAPGMGSTCSLGERLGRSLVGSLVGSAAGIASVAVVHNGAIFVVMPALTAGGAVMFMGPCR